MSIEKSLTISYQSLDRANKRYYHRNTKRNIKVFHGLWSPDILAIIRRKPLMKVKTSITLSEDLIKEIDELSSQYGNRSALIEKAVCDFLATEAKRRRDIQDMEILNRRSDEFNKEAEDVLYYQVDL
jgi:Arc/MetJ-type ribon-helix-helix transcriptional regulator